MEQAPIQVLRLKLKHALTRLYGVDEYSFHSHFSTFWSILHNDPVISSLINQLSSTDPSAEARSDAVVTDPGEYEYRYDGESYDLPTICLVAKKCAESGNASIESDLGFPHMRGRSDKETRAFIDTFLLPLCDWLDEQLLKIALERPLIGASTAGSAVLMPQRPRKDTALTRVQRWIDQASSLKTSSPDSPDFKTWQLAVLSATEQWFDLNTSLYSAGFRNIEFAPRQGAWGADYLSDEDRLSRYCLGLDEAEGLLKLMREEIEDDWSDAPTSGSPTAQETVASQALTHLELLLDRFHAVCLSLRNRTRHRAKSGGERPPLVVEDEYDVQYLLNSLLRLYFDDVRTEEWTPSYAGASSRMDFLLPAAKIVIEVKHARQGLGRNEIVDQLTVDIARYQKHPDCEVLVCFVYDPEHVIDNHAAVVTDVQAFKVLNLDVRVIIKPTV